MTSLLLLLLLSDTLRPPIVIKDEGVLKGRADTINCTGAGVTCSMALSTMTLDVPGGGGGAASVYVDAEIPSGAVNGSNVTYTLVAAPAPGTSLHLYANGVRLRPTTDYTLSVNTITMVAALQAGDWFYADYRSTSTGSYADGEIPAGTINGVNTTFVLANAPVPGASLYIFLNGVRLRPTTDYTITGTGLTMIFVPQTGDWLYADYRY